MEDYGQKTHPAAKTESPRRLAFERALLDAADRRRELPVLGVCMGMQLMGVRAGAQYNQHLPETLGAEKAAAHTGNHLHPVVFSVTDSVLPPPPRQSRAPICNRQIARSPNHQIHLPVPHRICACILLITRL